MTDDHRPADAAPSAADPAPAADPAARDPAPEAPDDPTATDPPTRPIDLATLALHVAELFRPDPIDPWRARIDALTRRWLDRPDARLLWTEHHEGAHRGGVRLVLPGRDHPPKNLGLARPLDPPARAVWAILRSYLSIVAGQIEISIDAHANSAPLRWQQLLTERQLQVARFAAEGLSNEQIAEQLGVAPRTVARLLQEVFKKLGCSNRGELAAERALGRPPTPIHQRVPDEPHPDDLAVDPEAEAEAEAEPDPE